MHYDRLDPIWVKKFWSHVYRLGREVQEFRKNRDCAKQVFVRRTLNKFISGKCFVYILKQSCGIFVNGEDVKVKNKIYTWVCYVEYCLGYNEKLTVFLSHAHPAHPAVFNVDEGDMLDLRYKEITRERYQRVKNQFVNDDEDDPDNKKGTNECI